MKKGSPWGYQRVMILMNDYDGFSDIMVVSLNFVWIRVEIEGLSIALTTMAMTRVVRETSGQSYVLTIQVEQREDEGSADTHYRKIALSRRNSNHSIG